MYIVAKNTIHVYSNTFENSFTSKINNKCYDMPLVSRRLTNNYLFWLAFASMEAWPAAGLQWDCISSGSC